MSFAQLCNKHLKEHGYYEFFAEQAVWISDRISGTEARVSCPAHQGGDFNTPSCSLSTETGRWKCFNPDCGAYGDAITFFAYTIGVKDYEEAGRKLALYLNLIDNITDGLINELTANLLNDLAATQMAAQMLGISCDTLKRFRIGIETKDLRLTIPILGLSGEWEDIRKYNRNLNPKIISWRSGHGAARIFPIENLKRANTLYLFEGEKDCLRAIDLGIEGAITITGGAGAVPGRYPELFKDKTVYVCYDIDDAGVKGATRIAETLSPVAAGVRIISLPRQGLPENGDFSDWANLLVERGADPCSEFYAFTESALVVPTRKIYLPTNVVERVVPPPPPALASLSAPQPPTRLNIGRDETAESIDVDFNSYESGTGDEFGEPPDSEADSKERPRGNSDSGSRPPSSPNLPTAFGREDNSSGGDGNSAGGDGSSGPQDGNAIEIDFADLSGKDLHGTRVRLLAHVIGTSVGMKSYQSPAAIEVTCGRDRPSLCPRCFISTNVSPEEMPYEVRIRHSEEGSLELIRSDKAKRLRTLKMVTGVPERCDSVTYIERERKPIQTLVISQPVELTTMRESNLGYWTAYYAGEPLTDNKDYYLTGYLQADPKTQESILNLETAESARNALDAFKVTDEVLAAVDRFKLQEGEAVAEHFAKLHLMFEQMTGIFGRDEIQLAILEVIFSVLEFRIGAKLIENGWVENLLIGDTRTGKSELARKMMRIINVGEFISGENVSAAGLIGGIEYIEKMPIPVWGKYPQNDRGMICLDEMAELASRTNDIMARMSSMRSAGVAEINKIQQARTRARVRSLHICNPKRGSAIASFDGGVRAIPTVVKNLEDIARYTKAYCISVETVDTETILQDKPILEDPEISRNLNLLAVLTWSLNETQVEFTHDANVYLREKAKELSDIYHASIPLWERGSGLTKLAKLSVPIAVLCGSFEDFGKTKDSDHIVLLRVQKEHCEYAVERLVSNYASEYMGYERYSKMEQGRDKITDYDSVVKKLVGYQAISVAQMVQFLQGNDDLTLESFSQLVGRRQDAESIWSMLIANNCLSPDRHARGVMTKSPAFIKMLAKLGNDLEVERARKASLNGHAPPPPRLADILGEEKPKREPEKPPPPPPPPTLRERKESKEDLDVDLSGV